MQETGRSRGWLKPPAFVLIMCAFAFIGMKAAGGLVTVWGAALDAIPDYSDVSHELESLAIIYVVLAAAVVFWLGALYSVRFAIRFVSRAFLPVGASPSEGKRAMGNQQTDQGARSKRRRPVFWFGVVAAAPALIWCCDRGMNELHRRSVINCFRTADRVIVEYTFGQPDDSEDRYTLITRTDEIVDEEQLAEIARHLSDIQFDEIQSNFLFILPSGTIANWGLPDRVSVYNSQDAAPRRFVINGEALYEIGSEGRVFLHGSQRLRRELRKSSGGST